MIEFEFESTPETDEMLKQICLRAIKLASSIVRCEDCKYFKFGNGCFLQSVDYDWEEQMGAEDFCSRGEPK